MRKKKWNVMLTFLLTGIILCSGCGKKKTKEDEFVALQEGTKTFHELYMSNPQGSDSMILQEGNFYLDGVELTDAMVAPGAEENADGTGQNTTENTVENNDENTGADPNVSGDPAEFGKLPPDKMPGVLTDERGKHGVIYGDQYYMYANEFHDNVENNPINDYANVWFYFNENGQIVILGGLDEYGKECAKGE